MKESKFIELLNLYLDQQLEPEDAARLEEEIATHPGHRRTYLQYCRMHKACITLFEQSRPLAEVGAKLEKTAAAAEEKVLAFPATQRRPAWLGYGAGLAAAACAAFVLLHRPSRLPAAPAREELVQIAPVAAPAPTPARGATYQPVELVQHTVRPPLGSGAVVAGAAAEPSLDWMNQIQFSPIAPLSSDEIIFDSNAAVQKDPRSFQSRRPYQGTVEKAAFQFQR